MNYSAIKYFCTVNGIGLSTSLFVSGCDLHCKGCFNRESWDFNVGKEYTQEVEDKIFKSIEPPYITHLSILGGEPLAKNNVKAVLEIVKNFRKKFGGTKKIWIWSGYYLNQMTDEQKEVLLYCDYLVDGRFEEDKFDPNLNFRGSSNQTIWEIQDGGGLIKSNLN